MSTDEGTPAKPNGLAGQQGAEDSQDDAIIGVAVRRSLVVILIIAVLAAIAWWFAQRSEAPVIVEDRDLKAPVVATPVAAEALPHIPFRDVTQAAGLEAASPPA